MKVVSKTDFDKTLNLPRKTIDTEDEIVKKDSFFVESLQDGNKFCIANEKNIVNKKRVNISEIPMPISDKITPTNIINKVLKDVIARYSILKGNYINHTIGFNHTDEMLKKITNNNSTEDEEIANDNKKKTSKSSPTITTKTIDFSHIKKEFGIVEKNRATLENNIRKQIYEIANLGTMINYQKYNYSTLKLDINNKMLEKFGTLYDNGSIYSHKKPVHWCTDCGKSVSQKDIKYRKSKVKNTYFLCKIKNDNGNLANVLKLENLYLISSTLRPWILLNSNKLIVAKDSKFSVVKVESTNNTKTHYIIESKHVKHVMEDAFYIKYEIVDEFDSNLLDSVVVSNPLTLEKSIQIYAVDKKYINIDNKNITGINLIGNVDSYLDYLVNKELNITENLNCVIDAKGNFNNFIPDYKGKNYKEVNEEVISLLKKEKMLFLDTNVVIIIPRCKSCNHEIIYRYLNKWYIRRNENIEKDLKIAFDELEKRIIYNKDNDQSTLKNGFTKILNTHDLSISNERKSSVPIPAFYCANCGNEIISNLTIDICKNILKEKGIDTWNKMTPEEILQGQVKCHKCDCDFLFKDDNSLNDAFKLLTIPMFNVSIESDTKKTDTNVQKNIISNNILEKNYCIETRKDFLNKIKAISFDTNSIDKINAINNVMLHTKVKENVKTIAKPLFLDNSESDFSSNLITTNLGIMDIVKKYGIDVLRLWAVHRSDNPSIKLTEGDIINVKTLYLQFRKTLKYILSNLYDFNPSKNNVKVQERDDLDIYIYSKMQQLETILDKRYNELNFPAICKTLYKFCIEILQNNYFEAIKYKLYITPKDGFYRRSVQSNLYDLVGIFVTYLQPILPLLFEECWPHIYHNSAEEERNILLFRDNKDLEKLELTENQKNWHKIFVLRKKIIPYVNNACNKGIIKNSLEARVIITCSESDYNFIKENYYDIIRTLNVSVIVFKVGESLNIEVKKALGVECHKCKNYSTSIGINYKYRHLCKFCANIEESIATNNVSKSKPPKDEYIDIEHINDDDEKTKVNVDLPTPPSFDTLNLENVEFDDRLGDKLDEEKLNKIKELNQNVIKKAKQTAEEIKTQDDSSYLSYHFENEFDDNFDNISTNENNDINSDTSNKNITNSTVSESTKTNDIIIQKKEENATSNTISNSAANIPKDIQITTHEFDDRLGEKLDDEKIKNDEEVESDCEVSNKNSTKNEIQIKDNTNLQSLSETQKNVSVLENDLENSKVNANITTNTVNNVDNNSPGFWDDMDKKSRKGIFSSLFKNKNKENEEMLDPKEINIKPNNSFENNINVKIEEKESLNATPNDKVSNNNKIENKSKNNSNNNDINETNSSNSTSDDSTPNNNNNNDNNNTTIKNEIPIENSSLGDFEDSFRD